MWNTPFLYQEGRTVLSTRKRNLGPRMLCRETLVLHYCSNTKHIEALSFSPLRMILVLGHSYMAFMISRYAPSIPTFLRVFIKKGCHILSNAFCIYGEGHMVLVLSFIDVMNHVVLQILNQPCIPGINPTWSWWILFLMYCWSRLASILLRILHPCTSGKLVYSCPF